MIFKRRHLKKKPDRASIDMTVFEFISIMEALRIAKEHWVDPYNLSAKFDAGYEHEIKKDKK